MSIKLTDIMALPLWDIVWECGGPEVCAPIDQLLDASEKSDKFKVIIEGDNRNLLIFWRSLIKTGRFDYGQLSGKLDLLLDQFPRWLSDEDLAFCRNTINDNPLPDTPQTAASIRRILQSPKLSEYTFKKVTSTDYGIEGHAEQPTYLIRAFSHLPNLRTLTLRQTVYSGGLGNFATPMDLRHLPSLGRVNIPATDIGEEDVLLAHQVSIYSKWPNTMSTIGLSFSPPPADLAPPSPEPRAESPSFLQSCLSGLACFFSSLLIGLTYVCESIYAFFCCED